MITGGACSGKTVAMQALRTLLKDTGLRVAFVDEAATDLIMNGFAPGPLHSAYEFQVKVVSTQLEREEEAAAQVGENGLVICDRGNCDGAAYLTYDEFVDVLAKNGLTVEQAIARYDAVFCLESVATGNPGEYSCESNEARMETLEEAIALDGRTKRAWALHPNVHYVPYMNNFGKKVEALFQGIMACVRGKES